MKTKQIEAYGVSAYTEQLYQGFKEGFKPDLETNAFAPVDIAGFFVCTLVSAEKAEKPSETKVEPEVPVGASEEQAKTGATENFPAERSQQGRDLAVQTAKAIVEKQAEVYKELMTDEPKVEPEEQPEAPVKKSRKITNPSGSLSKSKADKPTE